MDKSIRLIVFFIVLIVPMITYGQIGIGTEEPTQEFEIKGSIRLRDFESDSPKLIRQLKSDDEGNLVAEEFHSDRFYFKKVLNARVSGSYEEVNGPTVDLRAYLTIEVEPNTEAMIILTYNVPIFVENYDIGILPYFAGIRLYSKKEGAVQVRSLTGGNRIFSFPKAFIANTIKYSYEGTILAGKYVDVIKNTSNSKEIFTYYLKGYNIGETKAKRVYFGDSQGYGEGYGGGNFSCLIFNKFL